MIKLNVKIAVTSTERREEGVEFGKGHTGTAGLAVFFLDSMVLRIFTL